MLSFCLSTFNTLNYLKLAVQSVRENSYYKNSPFIIHAENCTDGTNEWLEQVTDEYNLEIGRMSIEDFSQAIELKPGTFSKNN